MSQVANYKEIRDGFVYRDCRNPCIIIVFHILDKQIDNSFLFCAQHSHQVIYKGKPITTNYITMRLPKEIRESNFLQMTQLLGNQTA